MNKCGEFWEADIIAIEIIKVCKKKAPDKENRLYYKLNTSKIINRNKEKRLTVAIAEIVSGNKNVLKRAWTNENRQLLESYC